MCLDASLCGFTILLPFVFGVISCSSLEQKNDKMTRLHVVVSRARVGGRR